MSEATAALRDIASRLRAGTIDTTAMADEIEHWAEVVDGPAESPDRHLTATERQHIAHVNGYGVAVQWFVGARRDDGSIEVIALGTDGTLDGEGFAWAVLMNGDEVHTSEAKVSAFRPGFEI